MLSFRVPSHKADALTKLAEVQQRDRSFLLNEAVDQYLALNQYHTEQIEEGIRQADAGLCVSDEEAQRYMDEQTLALRSNLSALKPVAKVVG